MGASPAAKVSPKKLNSDVGTLLNLLFGAKFDVMDQDDTPQQTTKGIWTAVDQESSILIFDIEGTDSAQRGDNRLNFEQTTSLFALAIADVLMINMWTHDIGRYKGSQMGLLKIIFEVNLKLFDQQCMKKLLFVLRDFDDRDENAEELMQKLLRDMEAVWASIYKPEKFAHTKPKDFF